METNLNEEPQGSVIRITLEEANSDHVGDLIKRQMSLRGETGITRDVRRPWFYQNWFVFMVAGLLAAVAAWAIINPFFKDLEYVQGKVEMLDTADLPSRTLGEGDNALKLRARPSAWIQINGDKILVLSDTTNLLPGGKKGMVHIDDIHEGQTLGVYVEYHEIAGQEISLARFLDLTPKPLPPTAEKMTLSRMHARSQAAAMLVFPLVAGLIGLAVGAADGLVCRLPRRALLAGSVGLLVGFIGGFLSEILAGLAYTPLNHLAIRQMSESGGITTFGFTVQMTGRALAWCIAGMAMGLGQGIAMQSKRLLLYGFVGGVVGGLFGGLFFDPVDLLLLGPNKPSAEWARLIGFSIIGCFVGGMIGLVELLARDAWLRMVEGPLAGKEFLVFKDVMKVGASPRSDIYLFNDPLVAPEHATIRAMGDECEIHASSKDRPTLVNNRPVTQSRLRHGDHITVGKTVFVFQKRQT